MPTSATGADRRGDERGFTLLELMVVLMIVGLTTSAVLLAGAGPPKLAREADALATRLGQARDEAVMSARVVDVVIDEDGYGFRAQSRTGWVALAPPFEARPWSDGVRAHLNSVEAIGAVRFDVTGAASAAVVNLERGAERMSVSVDGSGRVTVGHAPG